MGPRVLATLLLVAPVSAGLTAQERPQVGPGTRVRITPTDDEAPRRIGTLARVTRDTLWLAPRAGADPVIAPRSGVRRLEVSLGRRSHVARGALIGAIVGGAATGLFLAAFCSDPDTRCGADEVAKVGLLLGLPPVALGTAIGLIASHERWAPVPWPASARLSLGVRVASPARRR